MPRAPDAVPEPEAERDVHERAAVAAWEGDGGAPHVPDAAPTAASGDDHGSTNEE